MIAGNDADAIIALRWAEIYIFIYIKRMAGQVTRGDIQCSDLGLGRATGVT